MPKEKGSIEVVGKTFKYTEGEESELEAYANAIRHLKDLRDKAVKRISPIPGSQRAGPRNYETNVVLSPATARISGKGN